MQICEASEFGDLSIFDRLEELAQRLQARGENVSIRETIEEFVNPTRHSGRVYVKRRISNPDDDDAEPITQEGIFDIDVWENIAKKAQKANGVDVGSAFGAPQNGRPVIVPLSRVGLKITADPAEIGAIVTMSTTSIVLNKFECIGADDVEYSNTDSDSDSSDSDDDATQD